MENEINVQVDFRGTKLVEDFLSEDERYSYDNDVELGGEHEKIEYEKIIPKIEHHYKNVVDINGTIILDKIEDSLNDLEFEKFKTTKEADIKYFLQHKTNLKESSGDIHTNLEYKEFIDKVSVYIHNKNIDREIFEKGNIIFSKIEENLDKRDFDKFLNLRHSDVERYLEINTNIDQLFLSLPSNLKYEEFISKISEHISDKKTCKYMDKFVYGNEENEFYNYKGSNSAYRLKNNNYLNLDFRDFVIDKNYVPEIVKDQGFERYYQNESRSNGLKKREIYEVSDIIFNKIKQARNKEDFDKFLNLSTVSEVKDFLENKTSIKNDFNNYLTRLNYNEFIDGVSDGIRNKIRDENYEKTLSDPATKKFHLDREIEW